MKKTPEEQYRDAFNGLAGDPAPADDVEQAKTDDVTGAADEATPADGAAEGATESPAVAVVITGEEGGEGATDAPADGAEATDPADIQREKSWEGRMRKREQELAAREAALAEREAALDGGAGEVLQAADGAKVGEEVDLAVAAETDDGAAASLEAETAEQGEGEGSKSDDDIIAEGNATYGQEFEAYVAALIRKNFAAEADPLVGTVMDKIDGVSKSLQQGLESMQMDVLDALIDDLEEIAESEEFTAWIDALPEEEQGQAKQVLEAGTIGQVKRLVTRFAGERNKDAGPTAADIWAEDAATAVKGSSPVRLPDRPALSPQDEYSRAFNAA